MKKRQKTGGRKKGSLNKSTLLKKAAREGVTPLDYMLRVMRDRKAKSSGRDDMAKAAAPYLHAKRAAEDKAGRTVPTMIYVHPDLEDDDE